MSYWTYCKTGPWQRKKFKDCANVWGEREEHRVVEEGGGVECFQLSNQNRGTDFKKSWVLTVCMLLDSLTGNTWMGCMSSLCFVDSWQTKQNFFWSKVLYLAMTSYSLRMWLALSCMNKENILQNGFEYPSREVLALHTEIHKTSFTDPFLNVVSHM